MKDYPNYVIYDLIYYYISFIITIQICIILYYKYKHIKNKKEKELNN